ncbi:hypothetical protein ACVRXQ_10760 [Streptococcus panodentis]|uniref:YolD-like protein n=1 Tax=Streptococcus panodentis TaxID=1581472 RepID=A0ABS5AY78_9STRE|nr:hypothetical protein [Streptococcus panodentis]MBP2621534.1 hypothetical protein [Streptococcus panodentis]
MTDRSYLPYQSARDFQDRGMAKWAGFFLSEHSSALTRKAAEPRRLAELSLRDKLQLLSQAYSQQIPICITILDQAECSSMQGTVFHLDSRQVLLQEKDRCRAISLSQILSIQAKGGTDDGSVFV